MESSILIFPFLNTGQSRTRVSASPPSKAALKRNFVESPINSSTSLLPTLRPSHLLSRPSADTEVTRNLYPSETRVRRYDAWFTRQRGENTFRPQSLAIVSILFF